MTRSRGFTLIEVLVALAVFGLAALALLKLQGVTLHTTADLDQRAVAETVARNLAVELLSDPASPTIGESAGVVTNGGRTWRWTRTVARAGDARLLRVDFIVRGAAGTSPAVLTVVRAT